MKVLIALTSTIAFSSLSSIAEQKEYILRYDEPAEDSKSGWANRSIPLGNGYMGLNVFGRTDRERIQITENSLYDGPPAGGFARKGLNNFAELYLDFNHQNVTGYEQTLDLGRAVSTVSYQSGGVTYEREYFTSYPDKVMVIKLTASEQGALSFSLRPTIPFLGKNQSDDETAEEGKTGSVKSSADTITLSGQMTHYKIDFEGQFKVIPTGGKLKEMDGVITVSNATSAIIIGAVGTNYEMKPSVFLENDDSQKLAGNKHPHEKVTRYLTEASKRSYSELLERHLKDYQALYNRVRLDLGAQEPKVTTDKVVDAYPNGGNSLYLEEIAFHFGRYMLICSSRKGTLPPHLQGIWNPYAKPPWASQYLHDTNVQMAYAPVFCANLPELFESYVDYFYAYMPRQKKYADQYIKQYNPSQLAPAGENGWSGPFWSSPYFVPGKSIVAGFGTGGWIGQMFWDYYDFTRDKEILKEKVYPVIYEQANFASRFLQEIDGYLLAKPSSSPEQKRRNVTGTTFDQQMFYENHVNTLEGAKVLGKTDDRLEVFREQLPLINPIRVGKSGQVKEFWDEEKYGETAEGPFREGTFDPHHRHTSMLLGQYPGTLINDKTPAWLDAVEKSLELRTNKSGIGWARAERVAFWARVYDGDEAYEFYQDLLGGNYMHNLFNDHRNEKLFQADANYGATAGVAELLMQSQDHVITILPALPSVWKSGSYSGLLARGNFEVSAEWKEGQATRVEVLSKAGAPLTVRYPGISAAELRFSDGSKVESKRVSANELQIKAQKGQRVVFTKIPVHTPLPRPSDLQLTKRDDQTLELSWSTSQEGLSYNLYRAIGSAPTYELVQAGINETTFTYKPSDLGEIDQMTLKVVSTKDGQESRKGATTIWLK